MLVHKQIVSCFLLHFPMIYLVSWRIVTWKFYLQSLGLIKHPIKLEADSTNRTHGLIEHPIKLEGDSINRTHDLIKYSIKLEADSINRTHGLIRQPIKQKVDAANKIHLCCLFQPYQNCNQLKKL